MPIFLPSGLPSFTPSRFEVRSVKQIVKARWIDSAVLSTRDFLDSPSSEDRRRRVRSGRLSSVMASVARAVHSWIVVGKMMIPKLAFDSAVIHELVLC